MKALLEEESYGQIRLHLNTLIATGEMSGDEIYRAILELYIKEELTEQAMDKAEDVLDALSGYCHPVCYIGTGSYGSFNQEGDV